jgi:hypothetical protein
VDATRDSVIDAPLGEGAAALWQSEPSLDHLLALSTRLRDLYMSARWQTSSIRFRDLRVLFDAHHQAQGRIVEILMDCIDMPDGLGRVPVDQVQEAQFSTVLCRRQSGIGLLRNLQSTHESVLRVARIVEVEDGRSSQRDFTIGQVVLTNDWQKASVAEALRRRSLTLFYAQRERRAMKRSLDSMGRGQVECR